MTSQPPPVELIEDAAAVLAMRGYLDPDEDEIPPDVARELAELATEGVCGTCLGRDLLPDALADHFLVRKQEEWERGVPVWECDCGAPYKVIPDNAFQGGDELYEAREDDLFGDLAGRIRRDRKGRIKHSDTCGKCGASFAETMTRQTRSPAQLAPPEKTVTVKPVQEGLF